MKIANISFLEIIVIIEIVDNKVENCRDFCLLYIFGLFSAKFYFFFLMKMQHMKFKYIWLSKLFLDFFLKQLSF